MRCKCGNNKFYAHQLVRMEVIVDENGSFDSDTGEGSSAIYDAEHPYGPYTCTECGAEYDDLDAISKED